MGKPPIVTAKTLFWLTSRGRVARERPPGDCGAEVFRLEQLMSGQDVGIVRSWHCGHTQGVRLCMDECGRIVKENFNNGLQWQLSGILWHHATIIHPLPERLRKIKVIASNLEAFAKMFGATYDNSLYE